MRVIRAGERSVVLEQHRLLSARRNSCTDLLSSRKPHWYILRCVAPRGGDVSGFFRSRKICRRVNAFRRARDICNICYARLLNSAAQLSLSFLSFFFASGTLRSSSMLVFITDDKTKLTKRRNDPEIMRDVTCYTLRISYRVPGESSA